MSNNNTDKKKKQLPWADELDINKIFWEFLHHHFKEIPPPDLKEILKITFYGGAAFMNEVWYKAVTTEHEDIEKELNVFVDIMDTQIKRFQNEPHAYCEKG